MGPFLHMCKNHEWEYEDEANIAATGYIGNAQPKAELCVAGRAMPHPVRDSAPEQGQLYTPALRRTLFDTMFAKHVTKLFVKTNTLTSTTQKKHFCEVCPCGGGTPFALGSILHQKKYVRTKNICSIWSTSNWRRRFVALGPRVGTSFLWFPFHTHVKQK